MSPPPLKQNSGCQYFLLKIIICFIESIKNILLLSLKLLHPVVFLYAFPNFEFMYTFGKYLINVEIYSCEIFAKIDHTNNFPEHCLEKRFRHI